MPPETPRLVANAEDEHDQAVGKKYVDNVFSGKIFGKIFRTALAMAILGNIETLLFFLLLVAFFFVRSKNHNAVRNLSSGLKEILYREFAFLRILQTLGQISIPILVIIFYNASASWWLYPFLLGSTITFYTLGYQYFIRRLRDLKFPQNFLTDYFMDRYVMIFIHALLIVYAATNGSFLNRGGE